MAPQMLGGYSVAMRLRISHKLILTFLGLTLLVLIATLGLARWSFERGFLDYVNALEQKRLESLAESLSREYLTAGGSWSDLSPHRFDSLLRTRAPQAPHARDLGPARPPLLDDVYPPPGSLDPGREQPEPGRHPERRDTRSQGQRHLPTVRARDLGPPTALFDLNSRLIAGTPLPRETVSPISVPIRVDEGQVGELRSVPRRQFESPQETAFSRQQLITSLLIGLTSLVMAVIVSLLLTRVLLAPIRRMIFVVSQLSNGDYTTRLHERRKDELGQLMNDLDRLARTLEENRASRRRWLADISHELRTPVTVLTGEIETLKDGIRPLDLQQVLSLDQEIARLRHLIEDLYELSVSDIGGLRYSFGPVHIRENLNNAVGLVKKRADEKVIEIVVVGEAGKRVHADSRRLDQLFSNLIENALAYTDSPGKIKIALSGDSEQVSVTIQDTPPGVSQDECKKLFDPLYRQDVSRSRRTAGAGLGLAICRNIVDAHQGAITASPSKLGGLCIHIVFPCIDREIA